MFDMSSRPSSSPFDEALSRPFLDEPVKKRWSLFTASTVDSASSSASTGEEYEAPFSFSVQEITFSSAKPIDDSTVLKEEENLNEEGSFVLAKIEKGIDLDLAILRERHEGIYEITQEMKQLNEIQKDLALTVDNQDDDIHRVASFSLEASEHAVSGLEEFVEAHKRSVIKQNQNRRACMAVIVSLLFLLFVFWKSNGSWQDNRGINFNGEPEGKWRTYPIKQQDENEFADTSHFKSKGTVPELALRNGVTSDS